MLGETGKNNSLLYIECFGHLDVEGLFLSVPTLKILKDKIYEAETFGDLLVKKEISTGRRWFVTSIQDFEGPLLSNNYVTLTNLLLGPYRCLINYYTTNYTDLLEKHIIVNAPSFLYYFYKLLSPFLPQGLKEKVVILGSDYKKEILKFVEAKNLPKFWGGDLIDKKGDPKFRTKILIPEEKNSKRTLLERTEARGSLGFSGPSRDPKIFDEKIRKNRDFDRIFFFYEFKTFVWNLFFREFRK